MRPWERESDTSPPDSPPPKPRASLSSLVVRPPPESEDGDAEEEGGNWDVGAKAPRHLEAQRESGRRYRNEVSLSPPRRGRFRHFADDSECLLYDAGLDDPEGPDSYEDDFTGGSDDSMFQDVSPPVSQRGRSKRNLRVVSPPYGCGRGGRRFCCRSPIPGPERDVRRFHSRSPIPGRGRGSGRFRGRPYGRGRGGERFQGFSAAQKHEEDRGRFLDISPVNERERFGGRFRDARATFARGRDTRDARRFRDHSPVIGRETNRGRYLDISAPYKQNTRLFERDFDDMEPEPLPFKDGGVIHNHPGMERAGDWLCKNPLCRNMNFAHREYCFNCDMPRCGPARGTSGGTRQKVARDIHASVALRPRRENGYRSPPHGWDRDGPRESRDLPTRHGGRFSDSPISRDAGEHDGFPYRTNGRFDKFLSRGRGFVDEGKRYNRAPWIQDPRERSRSPRRFQPSPKVFPRGSFMGRGRGERRRQG